MVPTPPPPALLTQVARLFPEALFYAPTQQRQIALTIDDIPTPGDRDDASTRLILSALETYNRTAQHPVRATFFVITDHLNPGQHHPARHPGGGPRNRQPRHHRHHPGHPPTRRI
jgi:hypothetical protein